MYVDLCDFGVQVLVTLIRSDAPAAEASGRSAELERLGAGLDRLLGLESDGD